MTTNNLVKVDEAERLEGLLSRPFLDHSSELLNSFTWINEPVQKLNPGIDMLSAATTATL
jgi:hypothetical protein